MVGYNDVYYQPAYDDHDEAYSLSEYDNTNQANQNSEQTTLPVAIQGDIFQFLKENRYQKGKIEQPDTKSTSNNDKLINEDSSKTEQIEVNYASASRTKETSSVQEILPEDFSKGPIAHTGYIVTGYSNPIRYRILRWCPPPKGDYSAHRLAILSCWIVCMSADVIRNKKDASFLRKTVTQSCIDKLVTMSTLLSDYFEAFPNKKNQRVLIQFPVVMHWVDGMFTSPETLEIVAQFSVGTLQFMSTVVLRFKGSRWICTLVDIG